MRKILLSMSVASVLVFIGCDERQSMKVTQDKQGHAYVPEGGGSGGGETNTPVAGPGEIWITSGPKDTLTSIAKKYNTTLKWIIMRNNLKDPEKFKDGLPPNTNLLVPDPAVKR